MKEKSLPTKGQAEIVLCQKRMLKLLQFKADLILMNRGLVEAGRDLLDAYAELSKCVDRTISLEGSYQARKERI